MKRAAPGEIGPQLIALLRRNLRGDVPAGDLPDDAELVALGLDSATAVNLLLDIEDTLGFALPASMLNEETFRSVGSLRRALEELVAGEAG